jgi:hypothetical protein
MMKRSLQRIDHILPTDVFQAAHHEALECKRGCLTCLHYTYHFIDHEVLLIQPQDRLVFFCFSFS